MWSRPFRWVQLLLPPAHFIDGLVSLVTLGMKDFGLTAKVYQAIVRRRIQERRQT